MDRTFSKVLLALTLFSVPLRAQFAPPTRTIAPDLQEMTRKAGLIFTGRVLSITPIRATGTDQISSVEVTFLVEQGLRGPRVGERLSIREWPGLWTSGERYRVLQRMMLCLYPPSKIGLTSPVGGRAGRFDVDRTGQILVRPVQVQILKTAPHPIRPTGDRRLPLKTFSHAIQPLVEESR
jgi:hypothetical protein